MSKVAFDFGVLQIYWYSICILLGMGAGLFFILMEAKRKKMNLEVVTDIIFYSIIWAVIGARLYYVLFNLDYYGNHLGEIFEIWNGGLAIHGGLIAGLIYIVITSIKRKNNLLKFLDVAAPGVLIGQAIGRWGNFFNGEVYGKVVTEVFFTSKHIPKFIMKGMYIDGLYREPLFLYESLLNLVGFIILMIFRRRKYIKEGQTTGLYLIWYGIVRLILEGMRDKSYSLMLGNFRVAQIVSIVMIIIGLGLMAFRFKTSRFEYLYNYEAISNGGNK